MSIKLLARDLYRVQKEVEQLEKQLFDLPWDQRSALEDKLRRAKAQREKLRHALDGRIGR
jgi:septal ring factor EnvC (AmiA/AmiB activator)